MSPSYKVDKLLSSFIDKRHSARRPAHFSTPSSFLIRSFRISIVAGNFNRHYAEHSGYFEKTEFVKDAQAAASGEINFYDSNTGKLLFTAPKGRTMDQFLKESRAHGWPSFRDEEVNWEYVRCLSDGESVSVDGTHLGHNLPDNKGSRYCINLVSVAGKPTDEK